MPSTTTSGRLFPPIDLMPRIVRFGHLAVQGRLHRERAGLRHVRVGHSADGIRGHAPRLLDAQRGDRLDVEEQRLRLEREVCSRYGSCGHRDGVALLAVADEPRPHLIGARGYRGHDVFTALIGRSRSAGPRRGHAGVRDGMLVGFGDDSSSDRALGLCLGGARGGSEQSRERGDDDHDRTCDGAHAALPGGVSLTQKPLRESGGLTCCADATDCGP